MRQTALAAALIFGLANGAAAQAPPPVPALPDSARLTSYSISSSTCACSVGFQIYASGTDVDEWIQVFVNGVAKLSTDPVAGWSLSSVSPGGLTGPRPITNAILTFNAAQTATVVIVGNERPRRLSQFPENRGVTGRDLNQAVTDVVAVQRELWDKSNRSIVGQPGEVMTSLPSASTRAGQALVFDVNGNPSLAAPGFPLPTTIVSGNNVWTGINNFFGSNVLPITADGAQIAVQNSSTTQAQIFNPVTGGLVYDGLRSTVLIPASSTVLSGNGFGAYVRNRSGTGGVSGGGVGYYDLVTCGVANSSCWGANSRVTDNEDGLTHAFTGITLSGLEIDYQVTSPATLVGGITQYILTTAVASVGGGHACSIAPGGTGKWTFCFISNNGASATAGYIGASAATGTSIASQPIQFGRFDSGGIARADTLFDDSGGTLTWSGGAGVALKAAAATANIVGFWEGGTQLWQIGALANGHFYAFDQVAGSFVWQMTTGGTLAFTPPISAPTVLASTIYSAAGTPLPSCAAGTDGTSAVVSDATSATYAGAYTSGGAQKRRVLCINGTGWITN